jgi:hypothetical protein
MQVATLGFKSAFRRRGRADGIEYKKKGRRWGLFDDSKQVGRSQRK